MISTSIRRESEFSDQVADSRVLNHLRWSLRRLFNGGVKKLAINNKNDKFCGGSKYGPQG